MINYLIRIAFESLKAIVNYHLTNEELMDEDEIKKIQDTLTILEKRI